MNEFVVTINNQKKNLKILNSQLIELEGKEYTYELSKVNNYSFLIKIGNKAYEIVVNKHKNGQYDCLIDGHFFETVVRTQLQEKAESFLQNKQKTSHHDTVKAPMPGLILKIKKNVGDSVEFGEPLLVLEAMKMENELKSPASGKIKEIFVKEGGTVEKDTVILTIE